MPSESRLRLVCVAPTVPHRGIDHAGGSYLYHHLMGLSEMGWEISLLAPASTENRIAGGRLEADGDPIRVELQASHRRSRAAGSIDYVFRGYPAAAPVQDPPGRRTRELIDGADVVDLQWFESYGRAEWFRKNARHAAIVATVHDVYRHALISAMRAPRPRARIAAAVGYPACSRRELVALNACDWVRAFKSSDLEGLTMRGLRAPGDRVVPYVELGAVSPQPDSRRLIFAAAMWRPENAEGAHWFLDQVWPSVVAEYPDAVVVIAGGRPPESLTARASPSVQITGYVPSLVEVLDGAAGAIAPLRRGAGLKFKVVQAMAQGFPVIGTSVAFEGLEDVLDRVPPPADTAPAFIERIRKLFEDGAGHLSEAGAVASQIRPQLDFPASIRATCERLEQLVAQKRTDRSGPIP